MVLRMITKFKIYYNVSTMVYRYWELSTMDYLAMAVSAPGRALEWAMQVRLLTFSKWIFWPFGRKFQVAQKSLNRLKRAIFFQALLAPAAGHCLAVS